MLEKAIEGRLVKLVEANGGEAIKVSAIGLRGFPDRLIVAPGSRALFVETKAPSGRLSPQQKHWKRLLERFGFRVAVPYTLEEVDALVSEFFGGVS